MPQSKNYYRKCELCDFNTHTSSAWSRHIKTIKHLANIEHQKFIKNFIVANRHIPYAQLQEIWRITIKLKQLKEQKEQQQLKQQQKEEAKLIPKEPKDLKQVCIYCIAVGEDKYVGHTFNLKNRISTHRQKCKSSERLLYKCIREIGGCDNVEYTELARYDNCDLTKAIEMETKHFYEVKPSLNMCVPTGKHISPFMKSVSNNIKQY